MADITIQVYLTDTLTVVQSISIAAWLADDSDVSGAGVTDVNGQIAITVANANYTARGFGTGYTVTETDFTVSGDATHIVYVDAVKTNSQLYSYYKEEIIDRLGGRNDARTLSLIMSSFNETQEMLSTLVEWEDLVTSTSGSLTANDGTYTFAELSITGVKDILSFRVNDGTDWKKPLTEISALDWDTYIAITASTDVDDLPDRYTRRVGSIIMQPAPDDTYAYNIITRDNPTLVSGDSSQVDFTDLDFILINFTTAFTWLKLKDKELADAYLAIADRLLAPYLQSAINTRYSTTRSIGALKAFT